MSSPPGNRPTGAEAFIRTLRAHNVAYFLGFAAIVGMVWRYSEASGDGLAPEFNSTVPRDRTENPAEA